MSSDTLLCTGEAQLFLSRRLDGNTVDIAFHGSGKILAHLHDMRRELGRLREHGCVDVADLPAFSRISALTWRSRARLSAPL